jgi:FKBP-type peptidyl-prolyl cis-trans isomerase FklB
MKKIVMFAALAMLTAGMTAKPKKDKVDATTAATTQTQQGQGKTSVLNNGNDSISYAAGYANTNGLIPFLQQNWDFDEAYMADFIEGLKDARKQLNDPHFTARAAGAQVSYMIQNRMIEGMSKELKGTGYAMDADLFYEGFIAALNKDTTKFKMAAADKYFGETMNYVRKVKTELAQKEGADWLAENKNKPGVVTTASGLQYKVITMGTGERPKADQEVEVKYEGHLIDGTVFDSSYKRTPNTTKFKCNQVIKGWTEGLQLMPVGSKFEFYIPYNLGYGERGMGQNIPPYATLIFTVELVGITK